MAVADTEGLPVSIYIAGGSCHDVVLTDATLDASFINQLPPRLIGDKAWDSAKHQERLQEQRCIELIAPKRGGSRAVANRTDVRSGVFGDDGRSRDFLLG